MAKPKYKPNGSPPKPCDTVTVVANNPKDGFKVINLSDYDPEIHKKCEKPKPKADKK